SFGQIATSAVLPAGKTTLSIQAGSAAPTSYDIDLKEQQHYTLVVDGTGNAVSIVSFSSLAPGRVAVRAINASHAINSVDVYLGDTLLNGKVEFGRPTERQNVVSGQYTVNVYGAGTDRATNEPLASQDLTLNAGTNVAVI